MGSKKSVVLWFYEASRDSGKLHERRPSIDKNVNVRGLSSTSGFFASYGNHQTKGHDARRMNYEWSVVRAPVLPGKKELDDGLKVRSQK